MAGPTASPSARSTEVELTAELGEIPAVPARRLDERGRLIPLSPEERKVRSEAAVRALEAIAKLPDDDPPGTEEAFMRGIDENRPEGRKVFAGLGLY